MDGDRGWVHGDWRWMDGRWAGLLDWWRRVGGGLGVNRGRAGGGGMVPARSRQDYHMRRLGRQRSLAGLAGLAALQPFLPAHFWLTGFSSATKLDG